MLPLGAPSVAPVSLSWTLRALRSSLSPGFWEIKPVSTSPCEKLLCRWLPVFGGISQAILPKKQLGKNSQNCCPSVANALEVPSHPFQEAKMVVFAFTSRCWICAWTFGWHQDYQVLECEYAKEAWTFLAPLLMQTKREDKQIAFAGKSFTKFKNHNNLGNEGLRWVAQVKKKTIDYITAWRSDTDELDELAFNLGGGLDMHLVARLSSNIQSGLPRRSKDYSYLVFLEDQRISPSCYLEQCLERLLGSCV